MWPLFVDPPPQLIQFPIHKVRSLDHKKINWVLSHHHSLLRLRSPTQNTKTSKSSCTSILVLADHLSPPELSILVHFISHLDNLLYLRFGFNTILSLSLLTKTVKIATNSLTTSKRKFFIFFGFSAVYHSDSLAATPAALERLRVATVLHHSLVHRLLLKDWLKNLQYPRF